MIREDLMIKSIYNRLHPVIANWENNHSNLVENIDMTYSSVNHFKNEEWYYSDNNFTIAIILTNNYFVKIYNNSYDDYRSDNCSGMIVDRKPCIKMETYVKYVSVEKGDGVVTHQPALQLLYDDEIAFTDISLDDSNDWISTIMAWINRYAFRKKAEIKEVDLDGQF